MADTPDNKVVSIFPGTVAPGSDMDPDVLMLAEELLQHVKSNNKIRAIAWVAVAESGDVITGRHISGLWGTTLVGGLDWVKHRVIRLVNGEED